MPLKARHPTIQDMVKDRRERWTLAVCLAATAMPLALFSTARNDFWEYCTTKAYGFPMPWYIDHCLCGKGQFAVNPLFCSINLMLWVGSSLLLVCLINSGYRR